MHISTFEYHKPTEQQLHKMTLLREAAKRYAADIELLLEDGPDKTYIMRSLRTVAMWVNVAVTRFADGMPRGI